MSTSSSDLEYVLHLAERIVRLFEYYSKRINPKDPDFRSFIERSLQLRIREPFRSVPYWKLHDTLKELLDEYSDQTTSRKTKDA